MSDDAREESALWLAKADQHLAAARILRDGRGPSGTACFLCQQAIEVALKALLVAHGLAVPRVHDLADLVRRLPPSARPAAIAEPDLKGWTPYAVAPRYPGFGDEQAEADLSPMIDAAARLIAEARVMASRSE